MIRIEKTAAGAAPWKAPARLPQAPRKELPEDVAPVGSHPQGEQPWVGSPTALFAAPPSEELSPEAALFVAAVKNGWLAPAYEVVELQPSHFKASVYARGPTAGMFEATGVTATEARANAALSALYEPTPSRGLGD